MKRMVMMATLLAFVLGLAVTASAADLTATGSWKIAAEWTNNMDMIDDDDTDSEEDFGVFQRVRTSFNFEANENLRGVLQIEIGRAEWGANDSTGTAGGANGNGLSLDGDDAALIEVKSAYVQFNWPNTDIAVIAGLYPLALPGGPGGNPIFDTDVASFVVTGPITDNISFLTGWARAYELTDGADTTVNDNNDDVATDNFLDAVFLALPLSFDGVSLTPYAAYFYSGGDFLLDLDERRANAGINDIYDAWNDLLPGLMAHNMTVRDTELAGETGVSLTYYGLTWDLSLLDPLNIAGAFHYGTANMPWAQMERAGWLGEISFEYTGFDGITPELYFAYSSGEDGNATDNEDTFDNDSQGQSERLPVIRNGYGVGSFWFGGGFLANLDMDSDMEMGFWTIGLFLKDISFIDGLTHRINILYVEGTNDKTVANNAAEAADVGLGAGVAYGATLTEKDSVWEFDLNTTYQIYDQLTAVVNLGYLDVDFDETVWEDELAGNPGAKDAAKLAIGVEYKF